MAYGERTPARLDETNAAPEGIFQRLTQDSKVVSHRRIPLGPANDGGGCHGVMWHEGKLWIVANRIRAVLRVDPKTWEPEFIIPIHQAPGRMRFHGVAWDNGAIWQVVGNDSKNYAEGRPGLVKVRSGHRKGARDRGFPPNSSDPHGLCDARRRTDQLRQQASINSRTWIARPADGSFGSI